MSMLEPQIANSLMYEIQRIEQGTDLKRVSVITRTGMKIATSTSDQLDADAETASSAALIDLAERLSQSTQHGELREILVKAGSGFVILQFINEEYMVFGGISNIVRVGFYMEFLRNVARKFAYILAGNIVTEQLQKEIIAQKERERLEREKATTPIAANFKMDKSASADMDAMKGVLDFLKDWGNDEGMASPSQDNIVGIDKDLMFGMDDLAPQPISQDQISAAQTTKTEPVLKDNLDIGLPDDILATLDQLSTSTTATKPVVKKEEKTKLENPYGIQIFTDEVPPVPLEDYVSFEIGSLTQSSVVQEAPSQTNPQQFEAELSMEPQIENEFGEIPAKSDGTPNFDAIASEYEDPDISLEEDAMLDALNELGLSPDKKKK